MSIYAFHRSGARARTGFTLLELVVVLTILAIMAAAVTPLFRGSLTWVRGDRVTRDIVATMRHAGEMAVIEGREYRVCLDDAQNTYWLMRFSRLEEGKAVFEPLPGAEGDRQRLPEGMKFTKPKARQEGSSDVYRVSFYPSGGCDVAGISVVRNDGETVRIDIKGGLGRIEVKEP